MMGKSTRFPNLRPKWMLTHPNGGFMAIEAIKGLNLSTFDTIYFVTHQKYEDQYQFVEGFRQEIKKMNYKINIEFVLLKEQTNSQPETVYECIRKMNITGFILVKDSDNFFIAKIDDNNNGVCYYDLNDGDEFNARNKSYIQFDKNGLIENIVEKKIVSSTFSVGGYAFKSAQEFCSYFEKVKEVSEEIYISNIIFEMLLDGHAFVGIKTERYEDWGTLQEWNKFKKTFKTLFIDLDGVLIENTSHKMAPFMGSGTPLSENIKFLRELYDTGRVMVIIVTARPDEYRTQTELELYKHGIPCDYLLMNLPHAQRIVINDFANSNPFPACSAVNLQRNSDNLREYL